MYAGVLPSLKPTIAAAGSVDRYLPLVSRILATYGASPDAAPALATWVGEIAAWNQRIDLTAARDDRELCDLMIADAALLADRSGPAERLVDVGSGAGAPGLPLAILRPALRVDLVEPMHKRATFLRLCIGKLGLVDRVGVHQVRGDAVGERYDVAISRATLAPDAWLALAAQLAPSAWVLLAKGDAPEMAGWSLAEAHDYTWPLTGARRRALRFVRRNA